MRRNVSSDIGHDFSEFAAGGIQPEGFRSASEMVQASLWLLHNQEAKTDALRLAINKGLEKGMAKLFEFDHFKVDRKNRR